MPNTGSPGSAASGRWNLTRAAVVCLLTCTFAQLSPAQQPMAQPGAQPGGEAVLPTSRLGVPRTIPGFGPNQFRLPLMVPRTGQPGQLPPGFGGQGALGTTPQPTAEDLKKFGKYVDRLEDPANTLDLVEGRTRLMYLKETPSRTQIADEEIVALNLIDPKQLILIGNGVGTTVLTLWFTDPDDANKEVPLVYLVRVLPDPETKKRLEAAYKALEQEINEAFPDSSVRLYLVGDKLTVSGQAKDIFEGTKILQIVGANAPGGQNNNQNNQNNGLNTGQIPLTGVSALVPPDALTPGGLPGLRDFINAGGPNVVNLLTIPGEQQVMLRVTVAEINRTAARSIGLNFSITNNAGITVFQNLTGNLLGGGGTGAGGAGGVGGNLPTLLDNGQVSLAINALRNLDYARSLAEPNLVTSNGQTASFQAGGQFPVPVVAGLGGAGGGFGAGLQGVSFVPFGVLLNFTPFITDKDRIRLILTASVSSRDVASGTNIGGAAVPGLTTRTFTSTVELREGQTLAVAGLIQNNLGGSSSRVPLIGDLPLFNNLLGTTNVQSGEQELVVLITPELVHPLEANEVTALPGSDVYEPGDLEFYLKGRTESLRDYDYRAPVRTDIHRMLSYRRSELNYIYGPTGHSAPLPLPSHFDE